MEKDYSAKLVGWILEGNKTNKPKVEKAKCECGYPTEKDGLALGFCRNHNLDCLNAFSKEVKIGAWSFAYLFSELQKYAKDFSAVASNFASSPVSSPPHSPPPPYDSGMVLDLECMLPKPVNSKLKDFIGMNIPDIDPNVIDEGWTCVEPLQDHHLPNYDSGDDDTNGISSNIPTGLIKSISMESLDLSHLMDE